MKKHKEKHHHSGKEEKKKKRKRSRHESSSKEYKKKKVEKSKKYKYSSTDSESSEESYINDTALDVKTKKETTNNDLQNQKLSTELFSKPERDNWMNDESFVPTLSKQEIFTSSSRQRKRDAAKDEAEREKLIKESRELNPFLKNEGSGLPEKQTDVESLNLPSCSVGDGGYSWLKKAYYRIQEQAQTEGRSMEEVAVERWGSLDKLISMIEEAEKRMKNKPTEYSYSKHRYTDRLEGESSKCKWFKKPKDETDAEDCHYSKSSFQFTKPSIDRKGRKMINQFKSSSYKRENNFTEEQSTDFLIHPSKISQDTFSKAANSSNIKSSSSELGGPSWKKPEYVKDNQIKNTEKEDRSIPVMYSEDDLTKLAAKQMKAELMGNSTLAESLKSQLEEARKQIEDKGFAQRTKICKEVVLTKMNSSGQQYPIQITNEFSDSKRKSKKYVDEDSKYSLKQMFEREKLTTADDNLEMFVDAAASQCGEASEIDFEEQNSSKKLSQKMSVNRQEERDIGKAIMQHQKRNAALEKCEYCLDQQKMKKHLIVDIGEEIYISLPNYQSLTDGHCLIVPKAHVSSFLHLDENEWREVQEYKHCLRRIFKSQGKSVIFLETSMNFRHFPHSVVECIPVSEEDGDMAPFYFKKAIQESEEEWAINKKLIELSKGLRHSVPKQLPYFHVEFDPEVHTGFAHVIEEEKSFPRNFGKEVVGGILDIDYNHLYKNKAEDPLKKAKEVLEFTKLFNKFKK